MIQIAHKIELIPNNKQKTHFRKAFGCARLAWNWGLAETERIYKEEKRQIGANELSVLFNSIKKEKFPFVCEVNRYATKSVFRELSWAYKSFFRSGFKKPKFKRKKLNTGSFYIGGDSVVLKGKNTNLKQNKKDYCNKYYNGPCKYLFIYKLGCVKMTEKIRFRGKINNVVISQNGDKFFASFSMEISEDEYLRTHPQSRRKKVGSVGIDLGLKQALIMSNGIAVKNPRIAKKYRRKVVRIQRQLEKRIYAKTKQERLHGAVCSNNYRKLTLKLNRVMRKESYVRHDFIHKVTSVITSFVDNIAIESLRPSKLIHNHYLAGSISDVSFGMIRICLEYKAKYRGVNLIKASEKYPSSKTCSQCGNVVRNLSLRDRIYVCPSCGAVVDRDFNASLNLQDLIYRQGIGVDHPEFTPADLTALLSLFKKNKIATSKVDTGIQFMPESAL